MQIITGYLFIPKITFDNDKTYVLNPSSNVYLFHYEQYSQIPGNQNFYYVRHPPAQQKKEPSLKEAVSEHSVKNTQHFAFYTQTKTKHVLKCSN